MASTVRTKARPTIHEFDLIRSLHRRYGHDSLGNSGHRRRCRSHLLTGGNGRADDRSPYRRGPLRPTHRHHRRYRVSRRRPPISATSPRWGELRSICWSPWPFLGQATARQVHQLYDGLIAACRTHREGLIGGDTSASSGGWFVGVTLVGMVTPRGLVSERWRIGDHLSVTGTVGDSRAGLQGWAVSGRARHGPREIPAGRTSAALDPTALAANRAHSGRTLALENPAGRLRPSICRTDSPATSAISVRKAESGLPDRAGRAAGFLCLPSVRLIRQAGIPTPSPWPEERTMNSCSPCLHATALDSNGRRPSEDLPDMEGEEWRLTADFGPAPHGKRHRLANPVTNISRSPSNSRRPWPRSLHSDRFSSRYSISRNRRTARRWHLRSGCGIAFCPLYGFHMVLVGLCTWAFKLNFVALLAGAFINNPWTLVPVLGATYWDGRSCSGDRTVLRSTGVNWFQRDLRAGHPVCRAFFSVGSSQPDRAALSYPLALYVITKHRQ